MSDLRNQLQAAKDAYASVKYPGDLAADVRRGGVNPWRLLLPLAPVAAIAAVIALFVSVRPDVPELKPTGPNVSTEVAVTTEATIEHVSIPSDFAPTVPAETLSVPSMTSVPSMPTIPTWSVSTDVSLDESNQG